MLAESEMPFFDRVIDLAFFSPLNATLAIASDFFTNQYLPKSPI
jgi:hypothetical protein